jgi:Co/Zn/Cd efflux system component
MSGFKDDDINIKSAYICCRNDAIGNLLIILSAYLVYLWGTSWPDVFAGLIIASLMFVSAYNIAKESYGLIKTGNHPVKFTKKD